MKGIKGFQKNQPGYWLGKRRPGLGDKVANKLKGSTRSNKIRKNISKSNRLRYIKDPLIKISISEKLKDRKLSRTTRKRMSIAKGGNGALISKKKRMQLGRESYLKLRETIAGRPRPEKCEVCNMGTNIHFDHDHNTGRFRGWICISCNFILGYAKDNPKVLKKLAEYLRDNK